ncbi:MAG TPA: hypothetical protein VF702_14720 [Allosphingosinicella sp.]|jgi:hypothetical protein
MIDEEDGSAVTGGNNRRVQKRKAPRGSFGEEKRQVFLDQLAGCANITSAARAAGVSAVTVNYHRRRDPLFAGQVAEALEAGYEMLDSMMVERAATGGRYEPGEAVVPTPETLDTGLALHLLSLRRRGPGP